MSKIEETNFTLQLLFYTGTNLVKTVRKLEKIDYKYLKLQLDLDFLQTCQHSNVIQSSYDLSWQIETYNRLWLITPARKDC